MLTCLSMSARALQTWLVAFSSLDCPQPATASAAMNRTPTPKHCMVQTSLANVT